MTNATISGDGGSNRVTLTNAVDGDGTPSTNGSDVTVILDNASLFGAGKHYDVNFSGGDDVLVAENLPYVNDLSVTIGFENINMGAGNDFVDLTRSGFSSTLDAGSGNDTIVLKDSGGQAVNAGTGDDRVDLDLSGASSASERELSQKVGQAPVDIDGSSGDDTLNLLGEWSLTLSSGNFTLDTNGDGSGDVVQNSLSSADFSNVVGFPALLNGTVQWGDTVTLSDGNTVVAQATFANFESMDFVCFTKGTMIGTPRGPVPVETLKPGQMVTTRQGSRAVRWSCKRRLDVIDLMANPKLLPIRIPAGAMSPGRPSRDLLFSPQHRLVVRSPIVERMFGEPEVLVAAKHLTGCNGIEVAGDTRTIVYCHIMLDQHAVVPVEGIEAETLLPGPQALKMLSQEAIAEMQALFPDEIGALSEGAMQVPTLTVAKGRKSRALVARHAKNNKDLYTTVQVQAPTGSAQFASQTAGSHE